MADIALKIAALPADLVEEDPQGFLFSPSARADGQANPGLVAQTAPLIALAFGISEEEATNRILQGRFPYWRVLAPGVNLPAVALAAAVGQALGRGPADAGLIGWAYRWPNATYDQFLAAAQPVPDASGPNPYGIYKDEKGFEAHLVSIFGPEVAK